MSDASLSQQVEESLQLKDSSEHPRSPALEKLTCLLRQTLRITITDGRLFLGTFAGTDRLLNILLINTDEFRLPPPPNSESCSTDDGDSGFTPSISYNPNPNGRFVGLVLIPWRLVVKAEVHTPYKEGDGNIDPDPGIGMRGIVDRIDEEDEELYT